MPREGKPTPEPLQDLDARLKRLKSETDTPEDQRGLGQPTSGLGKAFAIASHLVAGLVVGAGIGLLLDHWLGTSPGFLILFFMLGAAAGVLNVYRAASGMGMGIGYRPAPPGESAGERTGERPGESPGGKRDEPRPAGAGDDKDNGKGGERRG